MTKWWIVGWLLGGCALSFGQVQQQTYGNSSPIVNVTGAGANVHISAPAQVTNTTHIYAAIKALESTDDKDLRRVRELLQKGEFIDARGVLQTFVAKKHKSFQDVAIAKFSEAQILIADEEMTQATEALNVALALDPGNCQYRAMTGHFYVATGRFDEARGVLYARPAGQECLLNGEPRTAAMLYLARVRLAAELRNEADALQAMHGANTALRALHGPSARGDFGVKCLFFDLATGYWNDKGKELWPDAEVGCKQEMSTELPGSSPMAVEVFEFYNDQGTAQETLAIGDAIFKKYRDFDSQRLLGIDRLRRRALFAQMKSDQGMRVLWRAGDPPAAARLYADAYELMTPLVVSARPSVLTAFAQLVIRIKHLEKITTARVFPNTRLKLQYDLSNIATLVRVRGSVDSCDAIGRIRGAAWTILQDSQLADLWTRQVQCLSATAPAGSYSDLRLRYTWWDSEDMPTLESLNMRVALADRLEGFPVVENLHGKKALDMGARVELVLLDKARAAKGNVDEESLQQSQRDIKLVVDEALKDPNSHTSRLVLATWLLFVPANESTSRALTILSDEPEKRGSELSPYGRCLSQAARLKELDTVGVFSAVQKDESLRNQALSRIREVAAPGNLCKAVPPERSMGVADLTETVDRMIKQIELIDQVQAMRGASKSDEEIRNAPLTQDCLNSWGQIRLPLCMFYLPKASKKHDA